MKNADSSIWTGKRAALFDMDGTLVDSMWMWSEIDREYLGRFPHIPKLTDAEIRQVQLGIEGLSMHETAVWLRNRFSIEDSVEKMQADWVAMALDKYQHEVKAKPGAIRLLSEMKERGMKLGVCTSNSGELAEAGLIACGMKDFFDVILTSREVRHGKPNPDIYLKGAEKLGVRPEETLVFEDVENGVLAGHRAGMEVAAVADESARDKREQIRQAADYFIEDFREIL